MTTPENNNDVAMDAIESSIEPSTEDTTTEDSSPEQNDVETTDSPQEDKDERTENRVPYERFKEVNDQVSALKEQMAQMEESLSKNQAQDKNTEVELPEAWKMMFGDSDKAAEAFELFKKDVIGKEMTDFRERFEQEQKERQQMEIEEQRKWKGKIEDEITGLKDKGYKFNRNELLAKVRELSTDKDGNFKGLPPFEYAYFLLRDEKGDTSSSSEKKKVAGLSSNKGDKTSSSTQETPKAKLGETSFSNWRKIFE